MTALAGGADVSLRIFDPSGIAKTQVTSVDVIRLSVRAVRKAGGSADLVGDFTKTGRAKFCALTRALARRGARVGVAQPLAIEVAGHVYARPRVDFKAFPTGLCGSPSFEWLMDLTLARRLAHVIRG